MNSTIKYHSIDNKIEMVICFNKYEDSVHEIINLEIYICNSKFYCVVNGQEPCPNNV